MATARSPGSPRCDAHRGQPAGWRCEACGAALCPDCTYLHAAGPAALPACGRCRGLAAPITVRRAERQGYAARLPGALAYPVEEGGWRTLLGAALVFWALSWLGGLASLIATGLQWGLYFSAIRRTAIAAEPLDTPDFGGLLDDVVLPMVRGVLALSLVWVPALAWLLSTHDLAALDGGAWLADPVLWLLLVVGVAWAPAALIAAAISSSTLTVLDPRFPLGLAGRLGRDYALLVGVAVLTVALDTLAGLAAGLVGALPVPVAAGVAARALTLFAPLVFARAAGLLVHTRGDELGYGVPSDYLEPILAGAVPRGAPPPPPLVPAEVQRRYEAIELDPEPEAPPAEAAAAPPDQAGEAPAAPARPDPAALFEQARAEAAAGRFAEAAELLRSAADDEDHPVAASAWLVLGRLYRGRMGQPDAGRQALEYVVARWPNGEPARQARALLAAP